MNRALEVFDPSEIILNTLQDGLGFARAKASGEPFGWIAVILAVIASAFPVASWNNIFGRVASIFALSNEMVLRESVPQSSRASAISALMMPVFEANIPIGICKCGEKQQSSSCPTFIDVSYDFWILFMPYPRAAFVFFGIAKIFTSAFLAIFIWVSRTVDSEPLTFVFSLFQCIASRRRPPVYGPAMLKIFRIATPALCTVAFVTDRRNAIASALQLFEMFVACWLTACAAYAENFSRINLRFAFADFKSFVFFVPTFFAMTFQTIRTFAKTVESRKMLEFVASGASLEGKGDIKHGNLLKLSPSVLLGAGLGNPVVRRVIKPSQARAHYTTNGGFCA